MNKNNFNEEFFASVREKEVWKLLSGDNNFVWSETLIDRYQDKIDWQELSQNSNVQWSASMLEKYKRRIDWKALSRSDHEGLFSTENLKKFSSLWDWKELSSNRSVGWTMKKVEEFKDFIDWNEMINDFHCRYHRHSGGHDSHYTLEFFEKFKEYFPVSTLQQSSLWEAVVEIYKEKLIEEILQQ